MGCVHTHRRIPAIEGWGSPSCTQSAVKNIKEANRKPRKVGRVVSQSATLGSKHDKIQAQWALDIPLESMLEKI